MVFYKNFGFEFGAFYLTELVVPLLQTPIATAIMPILMILKTQ